jgi:hypothetical protein
MALIEIQEPTPTALRWFGVPVAVFFATVGALSWVGASSPTAGYVSWVVGAALLLVYYLPGWVLPSRPAPNWRRRLYLGWMYAAYPIGLVTATIVMAVVYYLVVSPIALCSRVVRRDPLNRKFDAGADSYWQPRRKREKLESYFRQF